MITQFVRCLGVAALVQLVTLSAVAATSSLGSNTTLTGEQKQWHKVSLTFTGPQVSETDAVNPFRNYRLDVTFKHTSGRTLIVPGYFAADGNAHNSGAISGDKWRVNFSPEATGTWTYSVAFRTGADVAVSASGTAGAGTSFNGTSGTFTVDATDKSGADFRGKGRLQEVGQHYLQHLGSKEYFVKAGAGSPENFLAYADFDNTTAGRKPLHYYANHAAHFRSGDPTWRNGKGKAIIGAVNYLAAKKMNSLYFLTMNVGGDGDDVFPWTAKAERYRFDVSKLAQWEIVFEHMSRLGIHLHMITQEQENDQLLDGGALGLQRKLYYRELVARFSHNLALTWNLGEENTNTAEQRDAFSDYFNGIDPYLHLIAVHTFPGDRDAIYTPMVSHPVISGASLQLQSPSIVHAETLKWVKKSADAGQKWVVAVDELGGASVGVVPDVNDPTHKEIVHRVLWGTLMAGGAGVEWYFGYDYAHHDLTCEDWTSRDKMWSLTQVAAQFFRDYMPLPLVANHNGLTSSTTDYCFGKPGVTYAVYLPVGTTTNITLPAGETYSVHWFNPRLGGALQTGSVASVTGGTAAPLGRPSSETSLDWVALLRRTANAPGTVTPPPATTMGVSKLTLIDASSQSDLRPLVNGGIIDLQADGTSLNVRADVTGAVGSVVFYLNGARVHVESAAPYAYACDDSGVYRKWTPTLGTHTLRAVPYSAARGGGSVGVPLEVTFTVVQAATAPTAPAPTPDPIITPTEPAEQPVPALSVTSVTLIDAANQRDLRALSGTVINLATDGSALNVRAVASGAGSVEFILDGKTIRTENAAPFALGGDDSGVYRSWTPTMGVHSLRVVAYSGANRSGTKGPALDLSFSVK